MTVLADVLVIGAGQSGLAATRALQAQGSPIVLEHLGERVVIVGAGNSAVQVGHELAPVATVSLATRQPIVFVPQCRDGKDVHYWLKTTGFDLLPPEWLRRYFSGRTVDDTGRYQHALETGMFDRRTMFTALAGMPSTWSPRS